MTLVGGENGNSKKKIEKQVEKKKKVLMIQCPINPFKCPMGLQMVL